MNFRLTSMGQDVIELDTIDEVLAYVRKHPAGYVILAHNTRQSLIDELVKRW